MDQANPRPCGRGHHKCRKKGARSLFYRLKNAELCRQEANKENMQANKPSCTAPPSIDNMKGSLASISLPEQWEVFVGVEDVQYNKLEVDSGGLRGVTSSLVISSDLSWSVHIYGKQVPSSCEVLTGFPSILSTLPQLL